MKLKILSSGSVGNCYILQSDKEQLLLDNGIPLKQVKTGLGFNVSNVAGCLVSHHHKDHDLTSKDLIKMGLKVVQPFDSSNKNTTLKKGSSFSFKPFELKDTQGNWVHTNGDGSPCENYGYFIKLPNNEILVYATDCELIKWKFPQVNHYLIEANYDLDELENDGEAKNRHVFSGHHSIQAACKFIQANQSESLKNVILCHLSSDNGSPEKFKEMMQEVVGDNVNVYIAKKGLEIEL